jgi:hypothetical protein
MSIPGSRIRLKGSHRQFREMNHHVVSAIHIGLAEIETLHSRRNTAGIRTLCGD